MPGTVQCPSLSGPPALQKLAGALEELKPGMMLGADAATYMWRRAPKAAVPGGGHTEAVVVHPADDSSSSSSSSLRGTPGTHKT